MPFSLRLVAIAKPGDPQWMMDPVEWLAGPAPIEGVSERLVHLNASYRDYILAISADELRAWHERDRHRAFEGVYDYEGWRKRLDPKIAELEAILAAPGCPELFLAHWLEWESGYE